METVRFSLQIPSDLMKMGVRLGFISEAIGNIIDDDGMYVCVIKLHFHTKDIS